MQRGDLGVYGADFRPDTGAERRRASDARNRLAGLVRVGGWVPAERLAELDALVEAWGFPDRAQPIEVAVRFLTRQGETLNQLDF